MHYFFDPDISENSTHLSSGELVHFKALRILAGDEIGVSSGKGFGFLAKVVDPSSGEITIVERLKSQPGTRIHLVQAVAKGGRDESALQACTELGISGATALQAERSVSRWDGKIAKNTERWQQIAISALKQSQQLDLPAIDFVSSVAEIVPKGIALVLDPRAEAQIGAVEKHDSYTIVVGPEGGFSEAELSVLVNSGFRAVRLGDSILRTSTAGPVAVACLKLLAGDFGNRLD